MSEWTCRRGEWISVNDELPIDGETVVVFDIVDGVEDTTWVNTWVCYYEDATKAFWCNPDKSISADNPNVHWMRFPEFPIDGEVYVF